MYITTECIILRIYHGDRLTLPRPELAGLAELCEINFDIRGTKIGEYRMKINYFPGKLLDTVGVGCEVLNTAADRC